MGEFFMAIPRFGGLIAAEIFKKSYNYGRKNKVNYIIIDVYCKMPKDMI